MSSIRIRRLSKHYGQIQALLDMNADLPQHTVTVLLGPSGCGKTTTLRLIAGLEKPDSGEIWIGEQQVSGVQVWVPASQRNLGMVFQDYALFPHLTVAQNVAFGLTNSSAAERKPRIATLLDLVGLIGMEHRYPHQLSGGQQQRAALARALAPSPELLLLDEPFSNLDASLRQTMREEVSRILREAEITTIFVTHDQEEALRLADQLLIMSEGRVLQSGSPEDIYRYPNSPQVAQFLTEANLLPGEAEDGHVETALGSLKLHDPQIQGPVDVVLLPEAVSLIPDAHSPIRIEALSFFGFHQLVTLRLENGATLEARAWAHTALALGDRVRLNIESPVVAFARK